MELNPQNNYKYKHTNKTKRKNKKKKKNKEFNVYKMLNGSQITCHGKPKKRDIKKLIEQFNLNYVITLLHDNEYPNEIQDMCVKQGNIKWHHIPLIGANSEYFLSKETSEIIIKNILILIDEMKKGPLNIYIHCSAGVHRTGTVLYAILRITGETPERAMKAIKLIREETYNNCGSNRIEYSEKLIVQPLLSLLTNINTDTNSNSINTNY